jgi:DNA-binding MarR family transcriptional regulator
VARLNRQPAERRRAAPAPRPRALSPTATDGLDFAELNDRVGYFLRRVQVAIFKDFIRTLAPMDVRPAQYSVLILIAANPGRSQAAIGHALGIERARLARMLHELERRRWIERRASSGDGRSHALFLTDTGEPALDRMQNLAARHEAQMVELIGGKRRLSLLDLLRDFG